MEIKGKTIIVTGGGNGIGRELVLELLKRGARVLAIDINESALKETEMLSGENSEKLFTHVLDITDRMSVSAFADLVIALHGEVHGLINNAGIIQPFLRVNDLDYNVIDRVMNVDFNGTLYMLKAFLSHFLTLPEAHIVNVSSMGGLFPVPGQSIYGAAKSAVKLLTEGLQAELQNTPVKVTLICPGAIETDIKYNSGAEKNRKNDNEANNAIIKPVKPYEAARIIIQAMEQNKKRVLVGSDIKTLYFLNKISSSLVQSLINKQMKAHLKE